ncbi:hypothetical protein SALBM135S_00561 [Streptomyces alboniger]
MTTRLLTGPAGPATDRTVIGENLSLPLFRTLSGVLAGHPYLKVVVDRAENTWHLLDTAAHPFHVDYIATRVLGMDLTALDADLDAFNASVYMDPGRRFLLGVLSLHTDEDADGRERTFLVLETTEADTMHGELLEAFYTFVRARVDGRLPLLLKPANHGQEEALAAVSELRVRRILSHELFGTRARTPLNPGEATGRLRFFRTQAEYAAAEAGLGWADIVAMPCLPDDVPRVAASQHRADHPALPHQRPRLRLGHTQRHRARPGAARRTGRPGRRVGPLPGRRGRDIPGAPRPGARPAGSGLAPAAHTPRTAAARRHSRGPAPVARRRPRPLRHQGGQPRRAAPRARQPHGRSHRLLRAAAPAARGPRAPRLATRPERTHRGRTAGAGGRVRGRCGERARGSRPALRAPAALPRLLPRSPAGHRQTEDGPRTRRHRCPGLALPATPAPGPGVAVRRGHPADQPGLPRICGIARAPGGALLVQRRGPSRVLRRGRLRLRHHRARHR